jgi:isopenicillin N synthase-like dioxygenase
MADPPPLQDIPVVTVGRGRGRGEGGDAAAAAAAAAAQSMRDYSLMIVRDERLSEADQQSFLDMMESYFEQSDGKADARPHYSYQVGVTPAGVERPRSRIAERERMVGENSPLTPVEPGADPKWRFFWRVGPRPPVGTTQFPELNAEQVVPKGFPEWSATMDSWGHNMLQALFDASELLAVGLGLPAPSIRSKMELGPHLLAPTGSDLRDVQYGDVLAGFHSDLNLLTIHGKSRFPGLHVWLRDGTKRAVHVPPGCLLVQAGMQLEALTGGDIRAGYHEVAVGQATLRARDDARDAGRSLWRVSSTVFGHVASDQDLTPLLPVGGATTKGQLAGNQVMRELEAIQLACK